MLIDFLLLGAIGFAAQLVDGALGMAFGVISTTALLSFWLAARAGECDRSYRRNLHHGRIGRARISGIAIVDWRLVARLGVAGVLGAVLGAWILSNVDFDRGAAL